MSNDRPRRPVDPWKNAEAVFKPAPPAPVSIEKKASIPGAKEMVSLRLDSDVLEHFQSGGPGWQERINASLRKASGID